MPELTTQDTESYQKLHAAAKDLKGSLSLAKIVEKALPKTDDDTKAKTDLLILQSLTNTFFNNLPKPDLSSFELLQSQVELTGGYLAIYQLFVGAIDRSDTKETINQASQELRKQYNQLKLSLSAIDDDFLDGLTTPCSDPLFLRLLTGKSVKDWTDQILSNRPPALTDSEVQTLTKAWSTAVTTFVEDARRQGGAIPGKAETIAQFFCIHSQLEDLYSKLSKAVASNS